MSQAETIRNKGKSNSFYANLLRSAPRPIRWTAYAWGATAALGIGAYAYQHNQIQSLVPGTGPKAQSVTQEVKEDFATYNLAIPLFGGIVAAALAMGPGAAVLATGFRLRRLINPEAPGMFSDELMFRYVAPAMMGVTIAGSAVTATAVNIHGLSENIQQARARLDEKPQTPQNDVEQTVQPMALESDTIPKRQAVRPNPARLDQTNGITTLSPALVRRNIEFSR